MITCDPLIIQVPLFNRGFMLVHSRPLPRERGHVFFYASLIFPSMKNACLRFSNAENQPRKEKALHKFIARFLQPLKCEMTLVSLHSLILLVRTETEG